MNTVSADQINKLKKIGNMKNEEIQILRQEKEGLEIELDSLKKEIKDLESKLVNNSPEEVASTVSDEMVSQIEMRDKLLEELRQEGKTYKESLMAMRMAINALIGEKNEESTQSEFWMVGEFHEACDSLVYTENLKPSLPSNDKRALRRKLITEEFNEYLEAEIANDIVGIADAIADLLYVLYGAAHYYNIPIDKVFQEVHRTNMLKVAEDGKVKRREDGKILKPEGWEPPDIGGVMYPEDIIESEK